MVGKIHIDDLLKRKRKILQIHIDVIICPAGCTLIRSIKALLYSDIGIAKITDVGGRGG